MYPLQFQAADVHAPSSNTAAVVTYAAAGPGRCHVLGGVCWSYSGDPTSGNLKVEDAGVTVFSIDITKSGPGEIVWPQRRIGAKNAALVITLAAGGSGVSGKVSVLEHYTTTGSASGPVAEFSGFGLLDFSQAANSQYLAFPI